MGAPDSLFEAAGLLMQMREGQFGRRANQRGGGGGATVGGEVCLGSKA